MFLIYEPIIPKKDIECSSISIQNQNFMELLKRNPSCSTSLIRKGHILMIITKYKKTYLKSLAIINPKT
jgi:hypothetical protein